MDFSLEQMARRDLEHWKQTGVAPSDEEVKDWVEFMEVFLCEAQVGRRYVYFDSYIVPVDADGLKIEGIHSAHDLKVVPQVEALQDPSVIENLLSNPRYWQGTALQADEPEE